MIMKATQQSQHSRQPQDEAEKQDIGLSNLSLKDELDVGPESFASKVLSTLNNPREVSSEATQKKEPEKNPVTFEVSKEHGKLARGKIIYCTPERGQMYERGHSSTRARISHASIDRLIEKLTDTSAYDNDFRDAFLLTYRSFSSPRELVDLLIARYQQAYEDIPSPNNNQEETTSSNVIIFRVISFLKHWIKESGYIDFDLKNNLQTIEILICFLEDISCNCSLPAIRQHAGNLKEVIANIRERENTCLAKPSIVPRSSSNESKERVHRKDSLPSQLPPPPTIARGVTTGSVNLSPSRRPRSSSVSSSSSKFSKSDFSSLKLSKMRPSALHHQSRSHPLTGLSPQEVAEQLTLMEATHFYLRISKRELTNRAWTRPTKRVEAPNVMAMIELFDARTEWVSSEILHSRLQTVERAKMMAFFIDVADHCYRLHNFNTLYEIITGLAAPCINQLHATWGLVQNSHTEKFQFLQQICSVEENYKNYRQAYNMCDGKPRLPCLFIIVKDLFNLEESMNSIENGLIHFRKFQKIHEAISEVFDSDNKNWISSRSPQQHQQRKRRVSLESDEKVQGILQHRLETVRKNSLELFRLAKKANTQESLLFVKSLSEAGFL